MYKKIKLLVMLFCLLSGSIMAQNIQVLMSPKPSPYLSDWQQQTETIKLIITNPTSNDLLVKIRTELFNGKGSLIANTDDSKMPVLTIPPGVSTYNPEDIIPSNAVNYKGGGSEKEIMRTGRIPEDNYQMCVALIDPQSSKPVGSSGTVCKMFNITSYQAPSLISPANKEVIKGAAIKGIVFRWSPVIPSPKTIVTYRLQVWEVLDGQNSMTALRSNMPIVEKDLKGILQTQWPIDFPLPDTGVTYVWTITPFDDQERKMVDGNGFAEPFEFWTCCWPPPLRPDEDLPTIITLISPNEGEQISGDITFQWKDKGAMPKEGYTLRIVEVINEQSDPDLIFKNPVVFEQKGIMGKSFKYPEGAPKFEEGKTYGWAVKVGGLWSSGWIFNWKPRPISCKDLKVSIIKNTSPRYKDGCCYDISITNNSNVSSIYSPKSFRIVTTNATIISTSNTPAGWNRTPPTVPPNTNTISWVKTNGYIPNIPTNLGTVCLGKVVEDPFYITYEWLNSVGKVICKDSIKVDCKKEPINCCSYALYFSNNQSNNLFKKIKITPIGTTVITQASSDEDIWVQNNDLNYSYITYSDLIHSLIPLIPVEEENIWFSIDPSLSSSPKIKVEWIDISNNVMATHILTLPCYAEKNIDDDIDWDSYTQITTGNQYNIFSGIDQVPCPQTMYKASRDDCPDILHSLSCDGSNNTILTITRSNSSNPNFAWKVDGTPYNSEIVTINSASNREYAVELIQYLKYSDINGEDSFSIECTNDRIIRINHPNPNFTNIQIGPPCPDFNIKFIYTDGVFDIFQPSGWIYSWTFKLGGIIKGTSNLQDPSMTFTDPGIYDVTIAVTTITPDGSGCIYSYTKQIELSYACSPLLDWRYDWCDEGNINPNFSYTKQVIFTNLSRGGKCPTYKIKFGNTWLPFNNGTIGNYFVGTPGQPHTVKFQMYDMSSGSEQPCGPEITYIDKLTPLLVNYSETLCDNGTAVLNTTSPNPLWDFGNTTENSIWISLHKKDQTVSPHYNPGAHTITLTSYDEITHAKCQIKKSFVTIDICCDEQKKLSPFYRTTAAGNNYKMRGKFSVKYRNEDWSDAWLLSKHTALISKTLAFKEKRKRNGNVRWKRLHPSQIFAGAKGDFYNKGEVCDCSNLNQYDQHDGLWDWCIRGVRFRRNIYDGGINYTHKQTVKSVHSITVDGEYWEENIYLGELGCDSQ